MEALGMTRECLVTLGITHILNACTQVPNFFQDTFMYCKRVSCYPSLVVRQSAHCWPWRRRFRSIFWCGCQFYRWCTCFGVISVGALCSWLASSWCTLTMTIIAGVSRSPAYCLAYLMLREKFSLRDSFIFIRRRRPMVMPNESFRLQLALLETKIFPGFSSVISPCAFTLEVYNFFAWCPRPAWLFYYS